MIQYGGINVSTGPEMAAFLDEHNPGMMFGLVVDAHLFFERMYHEMFNFDTLTKWEKSKKLEMQSPSKTAALSALDQRLPRILGKGGSRMVKAHESHFDQVKMWKEFEDPNSGLRVRAMEALRQVQKAQIEAIKDAYERSSPMYTLAMMSVNDTVMFITGLFAYMEKVFREYSASMFGEEKAWHVTTLLAKKLIELVEEPRRGVIGKAKTMDRKKNCEVITLAALRCLDKMAYVRSLDYESVPATSSELVKFVSRNNAVELVEALRVSHDTTKREHGEMVKKVKSISKTCQTLRNTVDLLEKRIAKLEKKQVSGAAPAVSVVPIESTDCSELCNIFDELTLDTIGVTKHAINGGVLAPTPPVDTLSGCEDAMETRELFLVQGGRFILEFEDEPIWLLALDTHCVEEIWVPKFSSLAHMGKHISGAVPSRANVFNQAVTRIGRRRFFFGSTPPAANVVLVCGSLPFCEAVASGHDGPMLLAIQTSFSSTQRRKWRQTNPLV
jgi:hypothetical protein